MAGKRYDPEFKRKVAREVATGEKRPAQACREYGISDSMLHRWRQEYLARGEAAFTTPAPSPTDALEQRIADLERLAGQLALENAILKKALATAQSKKNTP